MKDEAEDQSVLKHIQQLAAEEHRLFAHEALTDADRARLAKINIELDQCWDLLFWRQNPERKSMWKGFCAEACPSWKMNQRRPLGLLSGWDRPPSVSSMHFRTRQGAKRTYPAKLLRR